ncbi:MAG: hypothetical protein JW932_05410 [Deltaproteobacteria bacterium]|nr:hypothetical protein [Deltaproteobacteria bacterium]
MDFHGENSGYVTHNFHAFPAKFPPQLPKKFINGLTLPGEKVLDPMSGSGTAVLEAFLLGRYGLGIDIDPIALNLTKVKVTALDPERLIRTAESVIDHADHDFKKNNDRLNTELEIRFDPSTKKFIDYWFLRETQLELLSLIKPIEKLTDRDLHRFFQIALSSVIITKSGGVSLAYDLAHTRPHKIKNKIPRPAFEEFQRRVNRNIQNISKLNQGSGKASVLCGNVQAIGLDDESIDLIITSPPYASNAIDYMRAHKFSLVWFGYPVDLLSKKRSKYIGGESTRDFNMYHLPDYPEAVISNLNRKDPKKGQVLRRYYTEMSQAFKEMHRVLKSGKAAIIIVGSSIMRGMDTKTAQCLGEIGKKVGFDLVGISERNLDRNKRMMPARTSGPFETQIEERMHKEFIIGFYKPA